MSTTSTYTAPALNPTQLFLLKVFSAIKDEHEQDHIQTVLLEYCQKRVDVESDRLWEVLQLDDAKMDALMYGHQRSAQK